MMSLKFQWAGNFYVQKFTLFCLKYTKLHKRDYTNVEASVIPSNSFPDILM